MGAGRLKIDLSAVVANWRALGSLSAANVETATVVKADAYGLGAPRVAQALADAGARSFFVALPGEGTALRAALGPTPTIYVFSGYAPEDHAAIDSANLIPLLNSSQQLAALRAALPNHPFGLQFDSGMNRLGLEPDDLPAARDMLGSTQPRLIMSHLACADTPDHAMNAQQLTTFTAMAALWPDAPRSLAATGGILLGPDYHFDMTRPGVGLYGGLPFADATPVVTLDIPVIQTRTVRAGESVGYGNAWIAQRDTLVATISAGYADGLHRALANGLTVTADGHTCPVIGRISMDLITVDVAALPTAPSHVTVLGPSQTVDSVAAHGNTIGYEILTSLGHRYSRTYEPAS